MTSVMWAGLVATCCVASTIGTEAVRRLALRHDVLDVPNARSSHVRPTPRGGGLAVVLAVGAAWAVAAALDPGVRSTWLPVAVLIVAGVSALDDVRTLSAGTRFVAQSAAAAILIAGVGAWTAVELPLVGRMPIGVFGIPLTALWIVGLTNAYNFMDGIDGIAGGQAVAAGVTWATIGASLGVPVVALVGALVAAAAAGFLAHNWAPARIFMGDTGAASLGFTFAALPLVAIPDAAAAARLPLAGLLAVCPFVFDAVFTVLQRVRRGERLTEAHRSHLYQRLVAAGWTHQQAAGLYTGLAVATGGVGVRWVVAGGGWAAIAGFAIVPLALWVMTRRAERFQRTA
jgi:UDP-N-acetylmuramyl pentapeptide phosphotransferase/UDP-N-acetylglucosamine-1-phosphate transferase